MTKLDIAYLKKAAAQSPVRHARAILGFAHGRQPENIPRALADATSNLPLTASR